MRHILLREFAPSSRFEITPPHSYLDGTNGTLERLKVSVRTDPHGFMVTSREPRPDDKTVLLLGGSSIENLYIPDDRRIHAVMETALQERGIHARVLNGGVSDLHLLHGLNILINKALALEVNAVIYFVTPSLDVLANETEAGFWSDAHELLSPIRAIGPKKPTDATVLHYQNRDDLRSEKRLLRSLAAICGAFDIELTLATWPLYTEVDAYAQKFLADRAWVDASNREFGRVNQAVRDCAAQSGTGLLDLERLLDGLPHAQYFYDWNHPNMKGCEFVGYAAAEIVFPQT